MKFFQFGCWNQLKEKKSICDNRNPTNPLSRVMKTLAEKTIETAPDFIIISGDNYYSEKPEAVVKKKIIHQDQLISGLQCLPKDIEINMILGNHDLETQTKKGNLFISAADNVSAADAGEKKEDGNCFILQSELANLLPNIKYDFFISKYDEISQTLILMLDTSMYDTDDNMSMLPCYQYIINGRKYSIAELIEEQRKRVIEEINKYKFNKLIISGHHPIYSYKLKYTSEKKKYEVVEGFPLFIELLIEINRIINNPGMNYYYLCADLHLYQQGKVILDDGKMVINQYVTGTGGTELDPNPFDPKYADAKGRMHNEGGLVAMMDKEKYIMTADDIRESNEKYDYGFLQVEIIGGGGEEPRFNFIKAQEAQASGGRKTNKKRKTNNKKKKRKTNKKKKGRSKKIKKNSSLSLCKK